MAAAIHPQVVTGQADAGVRGVLGTVVATVMIARRISRASVFARILPHLLVLLFFAVVYVVIFSA
jgi:hypothetical protein